MRAIFCVMRATLVSLEIVSALWIVVAWQLMPGLFATLDGVVEEIAKVSFVGSAGGVAASVAFAWKILFPARDSSELVAWPHYPELRIRALVGCVFVVVGSVCVWVGSGSGSSLPVGVPSVLVISGYAVIGIALFTMFAAALRVRAILDGGV